MLDVAPGAGQHGRMEDTFSRRLELITLPDCDGRDVRLGSLWDKQPAILVFLRHYG